MSGTISEDIDEFLGISGMSPSAFGRQAVGDPNLVFNLKDGRRLWPETEEKIRKYIADNAAPAPQEKTRKRA